MNFKDITKARIFSLQKSKIKTMMITFLDKQGVIHRELVPEGQKGNSAFYVGVI
jgi:hypothetical protein